MSAIIILYGIIIGSFLNVCIYRIPKKETIVSGRSHCMSCGQEIKWYDLIPVISYIGLGGRCRSCKTKLSLQYPMVELLNGVAYLWVYMAFGLTWDALIYALLASALITLSFIDWKLMIIPDKINLFILILGCIHLAIHYENWANFILGFFTVSSILLMIAIITRGQMGVGDIKLMAVAGLILGWQNILLALVLGSVIGSIISIGLLIVKKGNKVIPFGPYLSIGIFLALLYGEHLIDWYLRVFISI